ncbi:MAG TPA: transposase [Urbifossiella sp.]|nr:transposase [Urbifossiella sp.]
MAAIRDFTATRRNLPHWQNPGAAYFLTWRAIKSVILEPVDRSLVLNAIRHWDSIRWKVFVAVVMPDHVHVLAHLLPIESDNGDYWNLSDLLKSVKGFSSNAINRRLGRNGALWQDETFDRIIRDDDEFEEKWSYIRNNAVKAELANSPEEYPWLFESAGE